MSRLVRTSGRVAAAMVVALSAVGCVSLPDGSSVHTGQVAGVREGQGQIRSVRPGPQPGDSRESIIQGYLLSMMSYPSNPAVVREFMTPSAAQTWDPDQQTLVYDDPTVHLTSHQLLLKATFLGSLDQRGSWKSLTGPTPGEEVSMKRVAGEWRIANPVEGTLINTAQFNLYYRQLALYFYDPKFSVLAADPVYLESGDPSVTATSLVQNLLKGPTLGMAGVARSAAPAGTQLVSPVTVNSSGFATVSLSDNVLSLDPDGRASLAKQLAWTLNQELVGVDQMSIRVNGHALAIPGRGFSFSVRSYSDPTLTPGSQTLYALSGDGRLVRIGPADGVATEPTGPISVPDISARSVGIDPSNTSAALVTKDGTSVVWGAVAIGSKDATEGTFRQPGTNLLRPSWDPFGLLWLVDMKGGRATLSVANALATDNGRPKSLPIHAPGIEGLDVRAFAVSRDGMRIAAVIGRGAESQLVLGMIKRPSDTKKQTPVAVVGVRPIVNAGVTLTNIRSLTWLSATTVAVLAADSSSGAQPYQLLIDGSRVAPISGYLKDLPVSIAAGPSSRARVAIGTRAGIYVRNTTHSWDQLGDPKLTSPAYPS